MVLKQKILLFKIDYTKSILKFFENIEKMYRILL